MVANKTIAFAKPTINHILLRDHDSMHEWAMLGTEALFIWAEAISVSEKTFRRVYERDLALL